jgi:hypothetical protein
MQGTQVGKQKKSNLTRERDLDTLNGDIEKDSEARVSQASSMSGR